MKVIKNGKPIEMTYEAVCEDLGFIADIHFVKVTNRGTVSFSCGKPNEIRAPRSEVERNGYKPSQALLDALR